jgi:hypothetical protein
VGTAERAGERADIDVAEALGDAFERHTSRFHQFACACQSNSATVLDQRHTRCAREPPEQGPPFQPCGDNERSQGDALPVPDVDELLGPAHGLVAMRMPGRECSKGWGVASSEVVADKPSRFFSDLAAQQSLHQEQTDIDPRHEAPPPSGCRRSR